MRYQVNDIVVIRDDYDNTMFAGKKCVITGQYHKARDEDEDCFEVRLYDKPELSDCISAGWIEGLPMTGVRIHSFITDEYGRNIDTNKFWDEFIRWVEDNHYQYCGTITKYETTTDKRPEEKER